MSAPEPLHLTLQEVLASGPPPAGNLAMPVFARGDLEVEMYRPTDVDRQRPHDRDEIYLVARGTALFFDGRTRYDVVPGCFLFVPAGQPHAFDEFSPDFAVWVLFFGPRGGHGDAQAARATR